MARKVFISVLGANNYSNCDYQKDGCSYGNVRFIQEATLRYLDCKNTWTKKDIAYILLTKGSEQANWVDDGQKDKKTGEIIKQLGLKSTLDNLGLPFPVEAISNLPDGNTEKEIWEIFERVFSKIQDNDELYFDITHGFRYLPMLILVLCDYSKFLKHVIIKSITYGNYDVSRELGHGLIVDLLPLAQLQDWTFAAGQYLDSGNVDKIYELAKDKYETFANALKEVIGERQTCRGIDIITSEHFANLESSVEKIDLEQSNNPIIPIIDNIKFSFKGFDVNENIKNGLQAAIWCFDNKLYQQSITILLETIISDVCQKNNYDWKTRKFRDYVVSVFVIKRDNIPQSGWKYKEQEGTQKFEREKQCLETILGSQIIDDWYDIYIKTDELRNDIDHAGMRQNAKTKGQFVEDMTEIINSLKSKLLC